MSTSVNRAIEVHDGHLYLLQVFERGHLYTLEILEGYFKIEIEFNEFYDPLLSIPLVSMGFKFTLHNTNLILRMMPK